MAFEVYFKSCNLKDHSLTHSLTHSLRTQSAQSGTWASVRVLHCCRSSAQRLAVSRLKPHSFSSLTIFLHQVTLGLPFLRLPWGVHLNATLSESISIRRTWPSHLHLLFLKTTESGSRSQDVSRALLLILFGQKISLMRRKHLVWKTSSFLEISLVSF